MINLLGSLVQPVTGLLDKFIEDKDQKNQLAHEISTMAERHAQELAKGQLRSKQGRSTKQECFYSRMASIYWLDMWCRNGLQLCCSPNNVFTLAQFRLSCCYPCLRS